MRRALITGAGGFLGRHVAAGLRREGVEIHGLGLCLGAREPLYRLDGHGSGTANLTGLLEEAAPDAVFHLAGTTLAPALFAVNVAFAACLLQAAGRLRLDATFIMAGSAAEYGPVDGRELPVPEARPCRPVTAYGISKHAQTLVGLAAAAGGMRVVVARPFNVVGPGMGRHLPLMDIAFRLAGCRADGRLPVGDLDLERDFIEAGAAARALVGLARRPEAIGQIVNLCSGRGTLLQGIVDRMAALVPWPVRLVRDDAVGAPGGPRRMVGDPAKLARLDLSLPPAEFETLLPGLVAEAENHWARGDRPDAPLPAAEGPL